MKSDTQEWLKTEAQHLYRCLFGGDTASALIENYQNAHGCLKELADLPAEQLNTVRTIVEKGLDATSIEPWLRRMDRRHALSAKLLLVAYLAECSGRSYKSCRYVRLGRFTMLFAMLRSIVDLLRGRYLKVRFELV